WGTNSKLLLPTSTSFDTRGILLNAWLANTPQILLSLAYFSINRVVTSAHFSQEWEGFSRSRKGLRVTNPKRSSQRTAHFLQIPYRWALPLGFLSGMLHWMLSQALFLVRLEMRDTAGVLYPQSTCACGYSPLSLLCFSLVFWVLLISIAWILACKVKLHMPVADHCSAVISAACHPPPDDEVAFLKQVQWGVVRNRFGGTIEHCTFSSEPVTQPEEGRCYA
ncbi:hypothetical protein EJ04DRAFT_409983, partial [Polyplosphaeria fusca]